MATPHENADENADVLLVETAVKEKRKNGDGDGLTTEKDLKGRDKLGSAMFANSLVIAKLSTLGSGRWLNGCFHMGFILPRWSPESTFCRQKIVPNMDREGIKCVCGAKPGRAKQLK